MAMSNKVLVYKLEGANPPREHKYALYVVIALLN